MGTLTHKQRQYLRTKRLIDIFMLLLLAPLICVVAAIAALAIRLDTSGPIIFSQERTGRYGRRFKVYKFRTMVNNAEELKAAYAHLNVLPPPDFKIPRDPRVTRVGRLLRATSLDELPQFFNVLRGDMTLVGPRPTSFDADKYKLWHTARLEVPPGITGLWQVTERHSVDFDERLRLDIAYIRSMSLRSDLRIAIATVGAVLGSTGV